MTYYILAIRWEIIAGGVAPTKHRSGAIFIVNTIEVDFCVVFTQCPRKLLQAWAFEATQASESEHSPSLGSNEAEESCLLLAYHW